MYKVVTECVFSFIRKGLSGDKKIINVFNILRTIDLIYYLTCNFVYVRN